MLVDGDHGPMTGTAAHCPREQRQGGEETRRPQTGWERAAAESGGGEGVASRATHRLRVLDNEAGVSACESDAVCDVVCTCQDVFVTTYTNTFIVRRTACFTTCRKVSRGLSHSDFHCRHSEPQFRRPAPPPAIGYLPSARTRLARACVSLHCCCRHETTLGKQQQRRQEIRENGKRSVGVGFERSSDWSERRCFLVHHFSSYLHLMRFSRAAAALEQAPPVPSSMCINFCEKVPDESGQWLLPMSVYIGANVDSPI